MPMIDSKFVHIMTVSIILCTKGIRPDRCDSISQIGPRTISGPTLVCF